MLFASLSAGINVLGGAPYPTHVMVQFLESQASLKVNVVDPDKPKSPILLIAAIAAGLYFFGKDKRWG